MQAGVDKGSCAPADMTAGAGPARGLLGIQLHVSFHYCTGLQLQGENIFIIIIFFFLDQSFKNFLQKYF